MLAALISTLTAILEFLNKNSGGLQTLFALIVAVSTAIYVILTRALVQETKELRSLQTKPQVTVYLMPRMNRGTYILDLVVQNIGLGAAYNVILEALPDLEYLKDKKLSELSFTKGFPLLVPGESLTMPLLMPASPSYARNDGPICITVKYQNSLQESFSARNEIDLHVFDGIMTLGDSENPLIRIAAAIDKLASK